MNIPSHDLLHNLPGADIAEAGLADLAAHRETVASLLLEIGSPRLTKAGLAIPLPIKSGTGPPDAELRLYALLGREHGSAAYSQYGAWMRRLGKLCRSLEQRARLRPAPN